MSKAAAMMYVAASVQILAGAILRSPADLRAEMDVVWSAAGNHVVSNVCAGLYLASLPDEQLPYRRKLQALLLAQAFVFCGWVIQRFRTADERLATLWLFCVQAPCLASFFATRYYMGAANASSSTSKSACEYVCTSGWAMRTRR